MIWQYNGVAKFSTVLAWCYQYLDVDDWTTNGFETISFNSNSAYILFMLRWT